MGGQGLFEIYQSPLLLQQKTKLRNHEARSPKLTKVNTEQEPILLRSDHLQKLLEKSRQGCTQDLGYQTNSTFNNGSQIQQKSESRKLVTGKGLSFVKKLRQDSLGKIQQPLEPQEESAYFHKPSTKKLVLASPCDSKSKVSKLLNFDRNQSKPRQAQALSPANLYFTKPRRDLQKWES